MAQLLNSLTSQTKLSVHGWTTPSGQLCKCAWGVQVSTKRKNTVQNYRGVQASQILCICGVSLFMRYSERLHPFLTSKSDGGSYARRVACSPNRGPPGCSCGVKKLKRTCATSHHLTAPHLCWKNTCGT